MACCGKKRRKKFSYAVSRQRFESKAFKSLINLKGKDIQKLPQPLLLQYHDQTHALYKGAIKHKPVNKVFINEVVTLHDQYVEEMVKRGIEHTKPLARF